METSRKHAKHKHNYGCYQSLHLSRPLNRFLKFVDKFSPSSIKNPYIQFTCILIPWTLPLDLELLTKESTYLKAWKMRLQGTNS